MTRNAFRTIGLTGATAMLLGTAGLYAGAASSGTGCCLQRQGAQYPWVEIGKDFAECDRLNQAEATPDDIFEEAGRIWWSVDC